MASPEAASALAINFVASMFTTLVKHNIIPEAVMMEILTDLVTKTKADANSAEMLPLIKAIYPSLPVDQM